MENKVNISYDKETDKVYGAEEIMSSVRSVNFAICVLEHTVSMLRHEIDTSPFPSDFYLEIIAVDNKIRDLRNSYICSLKFRF